MSAPRKKPRRADPSLGPAGLVRRAEMQDALESERGQVALRIAAESAALGKTIDARHAGAMARLDRFHERLQSLERLWFVRFWRWISRAETGT